MNLKNRGEVVLVTGSSVFAVAGFQKNQGPNCQVRNVGLYCMVSTCGDSNSYSPDNANAGAITFTFPGGPAPISMAPIPGTNDYEPFFFFGDYGITAGASITVQAAGGSVPGFTRQMRTAGVISPVNPPVGRGGDGRVPVTVDRSKNFDVTWAGLSRGWVSVILTASTVQQADLNNPELRTLSSTNADCLFPAALGKGSIPASALATFSAGSAPPFDPESAAVQSVHQLIVNAEERDVVLYKAPGGLGAVDLRLVGEQFSSDNVTFQ